MGAKRQCKTCGKELAADVPFGQCLPCLLRLAEDAETCTAALADNGTSAPAPPFLEPSGPGLGEPGIRRFGDFEILDAGGGKAGGMGVVHRARQRSLNRIVALKQIRSDYVASAEAVERFRIEAEAAARLDHPRIVPIYEIGECDGQHYFTMKYLEGGSLQEELQRNPDQPLPIRRAAMLIATIARALQHAHEKNIVHRDLKPGNILFDAQGYPHVTDFGLAKLVGQDADLTSTGQVMGSLGYMSPEQAQGRSNAITPASDLFSLGAMLYHLLTGRHPFRGGEVMAVLREISVEEPVSPHALNPAVDRDLETICLKCLEKQPQHRYASAAELAEDLERWLGHETIMARRSTTWERAIKWCQRRPLLATLEGVIVLALILTTGLGIYAWRNHLRRVDSERAKRLQETERSLEAQESRRAVAQLAGVLRQDPANRAVAERLLNALSRHTFLVPIGPAFSTNTRVVCWSADGNHLLLAGGQADQSWVEVRGRDEVKAGTWQPALANIHRGDISPNGDLIALANFDQVQVWDWQKSTQQTILDRASPTGMVREVRFVPGPNLLVVAGDRVVVWPLHQPAESREFAVPAELIVSIAICPQTRRLAAADETSAIHFWDLETGRQLWTIPAAHAGVIRDLEFNRDGTRLASAADDHRACLWETATGRRIAECRHAGPVYCASFSPDGNRLVTASADKSARMWDAADGSSVGDPLRHGDVVNTARFSPDGAWVVTASEEGRSALWEAGRGRLLVRSADFGTSVTEARFSPDGHRVCAWLYRRGARQFVVKPGQLLWQAENPPAAPEPAQVPPEERVRLERLRPARLKFIDVSRDGRLLATVWSDKQAQVYYRKTCRPVARPLAHPAVVNCARFSVDGRRLVTSTANSKLRVWDVQTGIPLTGWIESDVPVASVWFIWFTRNSSAVLTDRGRGWTIATVEGAAPNWLPDLAEAIAGMRIDRQEADQPVPPEALLELRATLGTNTDAGSLEDWLGQFLNHGGDRP